MNRRGSFDIQAYLVTFLIFIGIMVTFGTVANSLGNNYNSLGGSSVSTEFQETYNQLDLVEGEANELETKLKDTTTGTQDAGTEFLGDALNSVKLIIPSLTASTSMIGSMGTTLGIPIIWQRIFTTVLIVMLLTVIVFMIFKSTGK